MHRPRTFTNSSRWSLDDYVDDFIVYSQDARTSMDKNHSQQPFSTASSDSPFAVHGTLSHHNSIASSASTRSTKSRSSIAESTRTTATESTTISLPVTIYEVPHSYDDGNDNGRERDTRLRPPPTPLTQPQQSSSSISTVSSPVNSSFQAVNPNASADARFPERTCSKNSLHFVTVTIGTVQDEVDDVCQLLFENNGIDGASACPWAVDPETTSTVTIQRVPSANIASVELLVQRTNVTTILAVISLKKSIDHMYALLDQLDHHLSLRDARKAWWERLILIFNQTDMSHPSLIMNQRDTILNAVVPTIQARYGNQDNPPAVMFVSALKHMEPSPDYKLQCRKILYQLLLDNYQLEQKLSSTEKNSTPRDSHTRNHINSDDSDDDDDDDDDDDLLSATVIQISPQGITALDNPRTGQ